MESKEDMDVDSNDSISSDDEKDEEDNVCKNDYNKFVLKTKLFRRSWKYVPRNWKNSYQIISICMMSTQS